MTRFEPSHIDGHTAMEEAENGRWMSHEHLYEWLILAIDDQQKKLKTLHDARPRRAMS